MKWKPAHLDSQAGLEFIGCVYFKSAPATHWNSVVCNMSQQIRLIYVTRTRNLPNAQNSIFSCVFQMFFCFVLKLVQLAAMIFDRFNSMRWPQCINDVNMVKRKKTYTHNVIKIQFSHHLNLWLIFKIWLLNGVRTFVPLILHFIAFASVCVCVRNMCKMLFFSRR